MPPRKPRKQQPELAFQAQVIALCDGRDLWPVMVNPARFAQRVACNRGFPDLLILGPGGVLFRELKMTTMPGRGLSPIQVTWRDRVKASGQDWGIWTPRDLRDGCIERELAAIETPGEHSDRWALALLGVQMDAYPAAPRAAGDEEPSEDEHTKGKSPWWQLVSGAVTAVINSR